MLRIRAVQVNFGMFVYVQIFPRNFSRKEKNITEFEEGGMDSVN